MAMALIVSILRCPLTSRDGRSARAPPRAQGGLNSTSAGSGLLRDGTTPTAAELSGDCTTSGSNVVTCTKLNNIAFAGTSGHLVSFGAADIPADSGVVAANTVVASYPGAGIRSEEHTSELQSLRHIVCRLLLE